MTLMNKELDTKIVFEDDDWKVFTETDIETGKRMLFVLASKRISINHGLEKGAKITLEG